MRRHCACSRPELEHLLVTEPISKQPTMCSHVSCLKTTATMEITMWSLLFLFRLLFQSDPFQCSFPAKTAGCECLLRMLRTCCAFRNFRIGVFVQEFSHWRFKYEVSLGVFGLQISSSHHMCLVGANSLRLADASNQVLTAPKVLTSPHLRQLVVK